VRCGGVKKVVSEGGENLVCSSVSEEVTMSGHDLTCACHPLEDMTSAPKTEKFDDMDHKYDFNAATYCLHFPVMFQI